MKTIDNQSTLPGESPMGQDDSSACGRSPCQTSRVRDGGDGLPAPVGSLPLSPPLAGGGGRAGPVDVFGDETQYFPEGRLQEEAVAVVGCRRYQNCAECNRGTMGVIYRGFDSHLGREVALKLLHPEFSNNPEFRDLFMHEARIMSRLQHPGVVPIYELHQGAGNELFFTMEFVDGSTLKELLARRAYHFHDLPCYLNIFEKVCQTMAYAHSQGVIHRDLKPANLMVGKFGVVRVMDWGLAKVLEDPSGNEGLPETGGRRAHTALHECLPDPADEGRPEACGAFGRVMGTLAYMAPEQARGDLEHLDKRTDVFGLGAILCEILTGRPPYPGRNCQELFRMAVGAELQEVTERLDRCLADPPLVTLAKDCLHADPDKRPGDAGGVANALTAEMECDLKRSALDLARFFELSSDIFCLASLDGFFQRVNENFTRVLGFSKAELVSRPFVEFVHPDDTPQTLEQVEKLSLGLPVVRFRNRYRDVAGHYRWFEWTAKSIPEEKVIFAIARPVDPDARP